METRHTSNMAGKVVKALVTCRSNRPFAILRRIQIKSCLRGRCTHSTSAVKYASEETTSTDEVQKFGLLSSEWWSQAGDFDALKAMNKLRVPWIKRILLKGSEMRLIKPLDSFRILDVGCGGGLLSEPLARLGAKVTGIDAVVNSVLTAEMHAKIDQDVAKNVAYMCSTVEEMVDQYRNSFDAVVASEVIEHVNNQPHFIKSCSELIKPGGHLFITTINRTLLSMIFAKFAAEYIVRIVPAGVHDWSKFVTTEELTDMLRSSKLEMINFNGMTYNVLTRTWDWCYSTDMNYACHAQKSAR